MNLLKSNMLTAHISVFRWTLLMWSLMCCVFVSAQVTLGFKGEQAATVGIYVKDLASDSVIAENNSLKVMSPASVMKVITAATVYSTVDPEFRFKTPIYITGKVRDGVCDGNLVIDACADPTVDSENFPDVPSLCSEIVQAVTAAGIKEFKGVVKVEEHLSEPGCVPQWELEDVPWPYGAGLFGFNYRDNVYSLWPATKRTVPHVPNLDMRVVKSKNVNLKRGINSSRLTVYGPNPANKKWHVNTTMSDPASVFAYELSDSLRHAGIRLASAAKGDKDRTLLFVHYSPSLSDILSQMLIHSHNLYAEGMLRMLAPGLTRQDAVDFELSVWDDRGISTSTDEIIDGSGLSRANRLHPRLIADVLQWMANCHNAPDFVSLFPRVGEEGTVKSLLKDTPLQGKLALKTGSMRGVQCYAGYKIDDDGMPTHVVVILVNSFSCDRAALRKSIENFLLNTFPQ